MFCTYCGKELKDGSQFCSYCGKQLNVGATKSGVNNMNAAFNNQQDIGADIPVIPIRQLGGWAGIFFLYGNGAWYLMGGPIITFLMVVFSLIAAIYGAMDLKSVGIIALMGVGVIVLGLLFMLPFFIKYHDELTLKLMPAILWRLICIAIGQYIKISLFLLVLVLPFIFVTKFEPRSYVFVGTLPDGQKILLKSYWEGNTKYSDVFVASNKQLYIGVLV